MVLEDSTSLSGVWHLREAAHPMLNIPRPDSLHLSPFVTLRPEAKLKKLPDLEKGYADD
jgi:hypothetical protein